MRLSSNVTGHYSLLPKGWVRRINCHAFHEYARPCGLKIAGSKRPSCTAACTGLQSQPAAQGRCVLVLLEGWGLVGG
jgi:hypothetical protein